MPFTLKQIDKHIDTMIKDDTSLSRDSVYEAIATGTETSPDVLKAVFLGDGTVKINQEVLDKIAAHLRMKEAEHPGECEPGFHMVAGECVKDTEQEKRPCKEGEDPERDDCMEVPPTAAEGKKRSTLSEALANEFGPKKLENQIKGVLEVINSNKDDATKRYISEVILKVFETIPGIISAEVGDSTRKIVAAVDEMAKKYKTQETVIEELKSKLKATKGLQETLTKNAKAGKKGKGLYEQDSKGGETPTEPNILSEQSMSEIIGDSKSIPKFD